MRQHDINKKEKGEHVMKDRKYISFDWALKRLLRNKANFGVLEGFLTTLLNQQIKIKELLESEGNKDRDDAKYNRVDILAENQQGELLLIEVQGESEYAYFQRILFGASKLVTEYIESGDNYSKVKKVYSVNIVYFDLGQGKDFVYHGKTEFRGIHQNDVLALSPFQKQKFGVKEVSQLKVEIMEQKKRVCIWLTREESASEDTQKEMMQLLKPYREKQYFFAIYRSGTQDLTEMTSALLIYNIKRSAEREVQMEKAAQEK